MNAEICWEKDVIQYYIGVTNAGTFFSAEFSLLTCLSAETGKHFDRFYSAYKWARNHQ
jgi:hypothetical protein